MKVVENFAVDVFQSNVYILNSPFSYKWHEISINL